MVKRAIPHEGRNVVEILTRQREQDDHRIEYEPGTVVTIYIRSENRKVIVMPDEDFKATFEPPVADAWKALSIKLVDDELIVSSRDAAENLKVDHISTREVRIGVTKEK